MEKPIIVQKYGGSSVATLEQIKNISKRIVEKKKEGNRVVVVVSARGSTTDQLVEEAKQIAAPDPIPLREADMLLSVGERISIAQLSIAINKLGYEAKSLTGSQSGIITDSNHTNASILEIRPHRIIEELNKDKIVIVAGYQGVSVDKEITTLGRGGSDLTAIALAKALGAVKCEILSNVDGIYNSNPSDNPDAKLMETIHPEEMVEMAAVGAKVVDISAAKFWQKYSGDLSKLVFSHSQHDVPGTIVTNENMSANEITSISIIKDSILVRIETGDKLKVFQELKEYNLVPVMVFTDSGNGYFSILFDKEKSEIILHEMKDLFVELDQSYSVVSAVGMNIGVDIGIVAQWEEVFSLSAISMNTSYSTNSICSIVRKSDVDSIYSDVCKKFL